LGTQREEKKMIGRGKKKGNGRAALDFRCCAAKNAPATWAFSRRNLGSKTGRYPFKGAVWERRTKGNVEEAAERNWGAKNVRAKKTERPIQNTIMGWRQRKGNSILSKEWNESKNVLP